MKTAVDKVPALVMTHAINNFNAQASPRRHFHASSRVRDPYYSDEPSCLCTVMPGRLSHSSNLDGSAIVTETGAAGEGMGSST